MANTPSLVVERFLTGWKDADWRAMADVTQKTWLVAKKDPAEVIQVLYHWTKLHEFSVGGMRMVFEDDPSMSGVMADVSIYLRTTYGYDLNVPPQVGYHLLRVVCEAGAHKPSAQGVWGVNPSSLRRVDDSQT